MSSNRPGIVRQPATDRANSGPCALAHLFWSTAKETLDAFPRQRQPALTSHSHLSHEALPARPACPTHAARHLLERERHVLRAVS
jgi:hypothetical protein